MFSVNLCGGLGNQLFQIFTTLALSFKYSKPFFFLNVHELKSGPTIRHTYWDTFFTQLKPFLKDSVPQNIVHFKETGFHFNPIDIETIRGQTIVIFGYFQSPKYFNDYKPYIYNFLKIDVKKNQVKEKLSNFVSLDYTSNVYISLHFRFGDYKLYPTIYNILDENYYSKALDVLTNKLIILHPNKQLNINILYFVEHSELPEAEVISQNLRSKYPTFNFTYIDDTFDDWEQLLVMSLCNHNIISNSTFSWWGAYLNTNRNQLVCCPATWFMPESTLDTRDLYPNAWIKC